MPKLKRTLLRKFPSEGPINQRLPEGTRAFYRVGFNPSQKGRIDPVTGERFLTGSYPTKAGIEHAISRAPHNRVEIRVYGKPSWDTTKHTSPKPDQLDNVYVTFFKPKSELLGDLHDAGSIEDWVYATGNYNFERVFTVWAGTDA